MKGKKSTQTFRKILSVFLSIVMVMSAWVFTPLGLKAEAADVSSGTYYWRLRATVTNCPGNNGAWDNNSWKVYGKSENGTNSSESEIGSISYILNNGTDIEVGTGTSTSFPTKATFSFQFGGGLTSYKLSATMYLDVSSTGSSWTNIASASISGSSGWLSAGSGTSTATVSTSKYPVPTSVAVETNNITVPLSGTATANYSCYVKDNYGVKMSSTRYNASSYPNVSVSSAGTVGASGLSISKGTRTTTNDPGTVNLTNAGKSLTENTSTGTVSATYVVKKQDNSTVTVNGSKTFTITDCKYTVTYNNNGGGTLNPTSAQVYYGDKMSTVSWPTTGTRTGYRFIGMFDAAENGNILTANDQITANKTYYAHWDILKFSVMFYDRLGENVVYLQNNIPYGSNADGATAATKLKTLETDEANHYYLNTSSPWSTSTTNITSVRSIYPNYTATAHTFGAGKGINQNCDHGDGMEYTCTVCGYVKFVGDTSGTGNHTKSQVYIVDNEPTCTTNGKGHYYCTVCGKALDDVTIPAGHSYGAGVVTTAPKCNVKGVITHTCSICNGTMTDDMGYAPHNHVAQTAVAATCTTSGYTPYKCSVCNDTYNKYDSSKPALGHDYSWTVSHGTATGTCRRSGCSATTSVSLGDTSGHNYDTFTVTTAPTCNAAGAGKVTCSNGDGATINVTIPKITNSHTTVTTTYNAPTCTAAGSIVTKCTTCNTTISTQSVAAKGHSYSYSRTEPTCTTAGKEVKECACGNKVETAIPATGHKTVTVSATCCADGYEKCGVCKTVIQTFTKTSHSFTVDNINIQPTCVSIGVIAKKCATCDALQVTTPAANGHTWGAYSEYVKPTCTQVGVNRRKCSVCNEYDYLQVAKVSHKYTAGQYTIDSEATCTSAGAKSLHCTTCGISDGNMVTIPALGHDFSVSGATTAATCTTDGKTVYTCSRCSATHNEVIGKLGHNLVAGTKVNATCQHSGYVPYSCSNSGCSVSYNVYDGNALTSHSWSVTQTVGHNQTTVTGTCSVCGASFNEVVPSGHKFTKKGTVTEATCKADGSVVMQCEETGCAETITVTIPKLSGSHTSPVTVYTAPTCTAKGSVVTTCSLCSASISSEDVPTLGHSYGVGTVTTQPTCTAKGAIKYTCQRAGCANEKTDELAKNPNAHVFTDGATVAATCTTPQYTVKSCACGETYNAYTGTADQSKHSFTVDITNSGTTYNATATCSICGATASGSRDFGSGHSFATVSVVKNATCSETGTVRFYCNKVHDSACTEYIEGTLPVNANAHTGYTIATSATCTADGTITVKCSSCNVTLATTTQAKLEHKWNDGSVTTTATCTTDGVKTYSCTRDGCSATKTIAVPKTGHNWDSGTNKSASCTKSNYTLYKCQNANCSETYVSESSIGEALGHLWNSGEYKTDADKPTCTATGTKTYTCTRAGCGEEKTEVVPALGHTYSKTGSVAATCTQNGYDVYTCQNGCGGIYNVIDPSKPATGHSFTWEPTHGGTILTGTCQNGDCTATTTVTIPADANHTWVFDSVTPATCMATGSVNYTCSKSGCTATKSTTLPIDSTNGHKYETTVTPAACGTAGSIVTDCAYCGNITTNEAIPALGHLYGDGTFHNATCTSSGYYSYSCQRCTNVLNVIDETAKPTGHTWGSTPISNTATCTDSGVATYKCSVCNTTIGVNVEPLGHDYRTNGAEIAPTCKDAGKQGYKCSRCESSYVAYTTAPLTGDENHSWSKTSTVDATTESLGYEVYTCSVCAETKYEILDKVAEHTLNSGSATTPATCTAEGEMTYTCVKENCAACLALGHTYTVTAPIAKLAHDYYVDYTPATCVAEGSSVTKCHNCVTVFGDEITIASLGHDYRVTGTLAPTCNTAGFVNYECNNCHDTTPSQVLPATPSVHNLESKGHVTGDCTTPSYDKYVCADCGGEYKMNVTMASHTAGTETVVANATCTENGFAHTLCTVCGKEMSTRTITKLNHSWADVNKTNSACLGAGYTYKKCSNCGLVDESTITVSEGNDHSYTYSVVTAPDCVNNGKGTFSCTCGKQYDVTLGATGHSYGTGVYTAPTCKTTGSVVYTCTVCTAGTAGHTLTTTISAVPHSFVKTSSVAATCSTSAYDIYTCEYSGCTEKKNIYVSDPDASHTFTESTDALDGYVAPSCTTDGTGVKKCSKCSLKTTYTIAKLGHDYSVETATVASTCNSVGYKTYKCSRCTATETVYESSLASHSFGDWSTVQTASATVPGISVRQCSVCSLYEYSYTAPTGSHDYVLNEDVPADCTTDGHKTYKCARTHCDCVEGSESTYVEVVPKLGHSLSLDTQDATCTVDGYAKTVCSRCTSTIESHTYTALGHSWNDPVTTKEPTCKETGVLTYSCANCSATKTTILAVMPNAHKLVEDSENSKTATCTSAGYTMFKCDNTGCTYTVSKDIVNPVAHTASSSWTAIKTPSCTEPGLEVQYCKTCTGSEKVIVNARAVDRVAHSYTPSVTQTKTCTLPEITTYTCSCTASYTEVTANPTDHDYGTEISVSHGIATVSCKNSGCTSQLYFEVGEDYASGHTFTAEITKTPNCKETGTVTLTCTKSECPATKAYTLPLDGTNHIWNDGSITTSANCTTDGVKTYICTKCSAVKTEAIPKLGHTYDSGAEVKATCTVNGSITFTCTRGGCGDTLVKEISLAPHDYEHITALDRAASCTESAYAYFKCKNCDKTYKEFVSEPLAHNYQESTDALLGYVAPTCTVDGVGVRKCSTCSAKYTYPIKATGHSYASSVTQTKTCTLPEITTYTCTCGNSYTEITAIPTGHSYTSTVTTAPKCEAKGVKTYSCTCGDSYTEEIAALGHDFTKSAEYVDGNIVVSCARTDCTATHCFTVSGIEPVHTFSVKSVTPSTCTVKGSVTLECTDTDCDKEVLAELPLNPDAHNIISTVTAEASCTTTGTRTYTCTNASCSYSDTEVIPAKGHNNTTIVYQEATCTADGSYKLYCNACTQTVGDTEVIPALGHLWDDGTVTKAATCNQTGTVLFTCQRTDCTGDKEETIPKTDVHNMIKDGSEVSATCTTAGYQMWKCSYNCGKTMKEFISEANGHTAADTWSTITAPTCQTAGYEVKYCKNCPAGTNTVVASRAVNPSNHSYDTVTVNAASCVDSSYTYEACTVCGSIKKSSVTVTAAASHSFDMANPVSYTAPTNSANGSVTFGCKNKWNEVGCTATITYIIPAEGHTFAVTAHKDASCSENGEDTYTCTAHTGKNDCGLSYKQVIPMTEHTFVTTQTKAPTCTAQGEAKVNCSVCSFTAKTFTLSALGHTYGEGVETKKATCTEEGNVVFTCTREGCTSAQAGHTLTKTTALVPHEYVKGAETAPTCQRSGYTTYTCKNCTSSYKELGSNAIGHSYKKLSSSVEPLCGTNGHYYYKCENCDSAYDYDIPMTNAHVYTENIVQTASCTQHGIKEYVCTCGALEKVVTVPQLSHTWGDWAVVKEATATEAGSLERTCTCGAKETAVIPVTGEHNWVQISTQSADCTHASTITYQCSGCKSCKEATGYASYTKYVSEALGHLTEVSYSAPTCVLDGSYSIHCTRCSQTIGDATAIPAKGHHFDTVTETVLATCEESGHITYKCADCDQTKTVNLPINYDEHSFTLYTVEPTCTEKGYTYYKCDNCELRLNNPADTEKKGHDYSVVTTTVLSTCNEYGFEIKKCSRCEATEKVNYTTYGAHKHGNWVTEKTATCKEEGLRKEYCWVCGTVIGTETLSKTNNHEFVIEVTKPTCTEQGYTTYTCSLCELEYTDDYKTKLGHSWSTDFKITKYPTCTRAGTQSLYCTRTGCTELRGDVYLAPYGHTFDKANPYSDGTSDDGTYEWVSYKCLGVPVASIDCSYFHTDITFFASAPDGTPLSGAIITVKDGTTFEVVAKGKTNVNGYFTGENIPDGGYYVTSECDTGRYGSSGVLIVAGGVVEGEWTFGGHLKDNNATPEPGTCSHICHKDNVIGHFIRWWYSFISSTFGITVKCCDDMEWYGKYADKLK